MKVFKKIVILITFLLTLSSTVYAADPWTPWDLSSAGTQVLDQGSCGKNLSWKLTASGYLIVTGSGAMSDFTGYEPWEDYYKMIRKVYIGLGVTSIGQGAFYDTFRQGSIQDVYIAPTVKLIDSGAFHNCIGLKTIVFTGPMPELVYPFGDVTTTVYYPDIWTEIPDPGDYGLNAKWVRYPLSSLPEEFRKAAEATESSTSVPTPTPSPVLTPTPTPEPAPAPTPTTAPTQEKRTQSLRVSVLTPSVKAATVKKKAQTISKAKAFSIKGAAGTLTFTKKSGSKYLSISKKGVITVKKGTPKGTKTISVTVKAAGNEKYKAAQKTVTVSVKIK
jgi:hypothetical protein